MLRVGEELGMDLSGYKLTMLHQDTDFVLSRGRAIADPATVNARAAAARID